MNKITKISIIGLFLVGCDVGSTDSLFDGSSGDGGHGGSSSNSSGETSTASSSSNSSSSSESSSSGGCIPKTCITLAFELSGGDDKADACGIVSDSCGNYIDCGECGGGKGCGVGNPSMQFDGSLEPGIEHICGGKCLTSASLHCGDGSQEYLCSGYKEGEVPIQNGGSCYLLDPGNEDYTAVWCCEF